MIWVYHNAWCTFLESWKTKPHNLRRYKSIPEIMMPGGSISVPWGFAHHVSIFSKLLKPWQPLDMKISWHHLEAGKKTSYFPNKCYPWWILDALLHRILMTNHDSFPLLRFAGCRFKYETIIWQPSSRSDCWADDIGDAKVCSRFCLAIFLVHLLAVSYNVLCSGELPRGFSMMSDPFKHSQNLEPTMIWILSSSTGWWKPFVLCSHVVNNHNARMFTLYSPWNWALNWAFYVFDISWWLDWACMLLLMVLWIGFNQRQSFTFMMNANYRSTWQWLMFAKTNSSRTYGNGLGW